MIDAAKRASAKRITAVCPFYGYARQDRKTEGREPITARLLADMLTAAGADRVVCRRPPHRPDPGLLQHAGRPPHRDAGAVVVPPRHHRGHAVVVSPDAGRVKLAQRLANHLDADLAIIDKRRPRATTWPWPRSIVGDVEGRPCVLIDDMIDTAGTITCAAELLVDRGATVVYVAATHGVLSGPAVDRLKNAPIERSS